MSDEHRSESPWRLKFHLGRSKSPKPPGSRETSPLRLASKLWKSRETSPSPSPARKSSDATPLLHAASAQRAVRHLSYDFTVNIPTNIPYPPFVNVEGVPNFRDLGGYACRPLPGAAECSVRAAYVYRCSELSQLSALGMYTMVEVFQIKTLYDLRSEREFENSRNRPQGVNCISVPVFRKKDITPYMATEQLRWGTAPDEPKDAGFSQGYVDWYRQIATLGAKEAYRTIFEHIRDRPDQPFVFHCSAGKDRTGVLSALILKLCGVDNLTVAWEYALTVPGMGVWEGAVEQEMVGDSMMPIRSHGGMTREEARRICGSRSSNMLRWLEVVLDGEFNGAEAYLQTYCKFTPQDVEKIRQNLVVAQTATVKQVEVPGMEDHPQT